MALDRQRCSRVCLGMLASKAAPLIAALIILWPITSTASIPSNSHSFLRVKAAENNDVWIPADAADLGAKMNLLGTLPDQQQLNGEASRMLQDQQKFHIELGHPKTFSKINRAELSSDHVATKPTLPDELSSPIERSMREIYDPILRRAYGNSTDPTSSSAFDKTESSNVNPKGSNINSTVNGPADLQQTSGFTPSWSNFSILEILVFGVWILFSVMLFVCCALFHSRRRLSEEDAELTGFDEALQNYILLTFAHAQRLSDVIKRKEKLVAQRLQKTKLIVTKENFVEEINVQTTIDSDSPSEVDGKTNDEKRVDDIESGKPNTADQEDLAQNIAPVKKDEICDDDSVSFTETAQFLELPENNPFTSQKYENGGPRQVPNSCAICLEHYRVGDQLIWSANVGCSHAFHELCILPWCSKIIKDRPATNHCMCPCCRQEFVRFDTEEDENASVVDY